MLEDVLLAEYKDGILFDKGDGLDTFDNIEFDFLSTIICNEDDSLFNKSVVFNH